MYLSRLVYLLGPRFSFAPLPLGMHDVVSTVEIVLYSAIRRKKDGSSRRPPGLNTFLCCFWHHLGMEFQEPINPPPALTATIHKHGTKTAQSGTAHLQMKRWHCVLLICA